LTIARARLAASATGLRLCEGEVMKFKRAAALALAAVALTSSLMAASIIFLEVIAIRDLTKWIARSLPI
jgi:hypothetical protein